MDPLVHHLDQPTDQSIKPRAHAPYLTYQIPPTRARVGLSPLAPPRANHLRVPRADATPCEPTDFV
jgi:hypothetical protein